LPSVIKNKQKTNINKEDKARGGREYNGGKKKRGGESHY